MALKDAVPDSSFAMLQNTEHMEEICDLSRENVPYSIRSNGWTDSKQTDKKWLDKPFGTDQLDGWTDANFFRTVKSNGWTDVPFLNG